jgi:preprotein translocase subunit SecE
VTLLAQLDPPKAAGLAGYVQAHPVLATVYAVIIGLILVASFRFRGVIAKFVRETRLELAKCTWPWDPTQHGTARYKELIDSTIVVLIAMVLLGAYTSAFDFILMRATGFILNF